MVEAGCNGHSVDRETVAAIAEIEEEILQKIKPEYARIGLMDFNDEFAASAAEVADILYRASAYLRITLRPQEVSSPMNISWSEGMAEAYQRGLSDGKMSLETAENMGECAWQSETFVACYCQGFGHGAQRCACPSYINGRDKMRGRKFRCVNCGQEARG